MGCAHSQPAAKDDVNQRSEEGGTGALQLAQITQQNLAGDKDQACHGQAEAKEPVQLKPSPMSEANPTDMSGIHSRACSSERAPDVTPGMELRTSDDDASLLSGASPGTLPDIEVSEDILRHQTLALMDLLDREPDAHLAVLSAVANRIFNMPVGGVTLVESSEVDLRSLLGLGGKVKREETFCQHLMACKEPEAFLVEDARQHWRFRQLPVVKAGLFASYAGAPLVAHNGARLGALCLLDTQPRTFSGHDCLILCMLAELAVREMERRWRDAHPEKAMELSTPALGRLVRDPALLDEGVLLVDSGDARWPIVYANTAAAELAGVDWTLDSKLHFWDLFTLPDDSRLVWEEHARVRATGNLELRLQCALGNSHSDCLLRIRTLAPDTLTGTFPQVLLPTNPLPQVSPSAASPTFFFVSVSSISTAQPAAPVLRSSFSNPVNSIATAGTAAPAGSSPNGHATAAEGHPSEDSDDCSSGSPGGQGEPFSDALRDQDTPLSDLRLGRAKLLAEDTCGRTYRAQWRGVTCAVRVLDCVHGDSAGPLKCCHLLRAKLSQGLRHANIVRTYHVATDLSDAEVVDDGTRCQSGSVALDELGRVETRPRALIVMEHMDMGSLHSANKGIFHQRQTPRPEAADMKAILLSAAEIASALCYLHSKDILHGTLSGDNVLVSFSNKDSRDFTCKVANFGCSQVCTGSGRHGQAALFCAAPELLMKAQHTKAADVWAFGVLLWEMLHGKRAWAGLPGLTILYNITILKQHLRFPPCTPPEFEALASSCMQFDARLRPTFTAISQRIQAMIALSAASV